MILCHQHNIAQDPVYYLVYAPMVTRAVNTIAPKVDSIVLSQYKTAI